jgi:hypothetical protein
MRLLFATILYSAICYMIFRVLEAQLFTVFFVLIALFAAAILFEGNIQQKDFSSAGNGTMKVNSVSLFFARTFEMLILLVGGYFLFI